MENKNQLIDFERAKKSVMNILAGKVNTPTAIKVSIALQEAIVDAVPVVHGRWMPCGFGKEIMCSVCGCELDDVWEYKHCPDCGAKMDGGI